MILTDSSALYAALGIVLVTTIVIIVLQSTVGFLRKKSHRITLGRNNNNSSNSAESVVRLVLIEKEILSHDTRRFRFALPSKHHILGLPVGQHISLKYTSAEGKLVSRPYTPVSAQDALGYVDLVVKVYFRGVHPKFPDGGKMSQHLDAMQVGESILVSGPKGKLSYHGNGRVHIRHRVRDPSVDVRQARQIGMIAGGTGITPMLQVLRQALNDPNDTTEFSLIFANQTEKDILLRHELDRYAAEHDNFKVWYTVDKGSPNWKYSTGFVTRDMIQEHLPPPGNDVQILICGPAPMVKFAIFPAFEDIGYEAKHYFAF